MNTETIGAVTLGVVFVLVILMVLGWRFPHTLRARLLVGVVLGALAVGAFIYVSDSVSTFVERSGLSDMTAETRQ